MYSPNNPWHCAHLPPDHVGGPDGGGAVAQRQHDLAPGQQPRPHPERAVVHDAVVTPDNIYPCGGATESRYFLRQRKQIFFTTNLDIYHLASTARSTPYELAPLEANLTSRHERWISLNVGLGARDSFISSREKYTSSLLMRCFLIQK